MSLIRKFLKSIWLWLLRSSANKSICGLTIINIRRGSLKGKKMILNLDPKNGWTDTEYLHGYPQEREQVALIKKLLTPDQAAWDIGIYRGFYTLLFTDLVGFNGVVVAIELDSKNVEVVKEVSKLNNLTNIQVLNFGISNKNEKAMFISSASSNSRMVNTFKGNFVDEPVLAKGETFREVEFKTINWLAANIGAPDFVKIDIDGAELYALDEADKIFDNENAIVLIESHNHQTNLKITSFFTANKCSVYSSNEKRFFHNGEIFWGTSIGCKNQERLKQLLES